MVPVWVYFWRYLCVSLRGAITANIKLNKDEKWPFPSPQLRAPDQPTGRRERACRQGSHSHSKANGVQSKRADISHGESH